jgi:hypothetical protein
MNSRFLPLIAAAAFLAVHASAAQAQVTAAGFKVGPSFSTLAIDGEDTPGTLSRVTGGPFVRFGFGRLGLQTELMYVTKGAKDSFVDDDFDLTVDGEVRFSYLEVPLLLVVPIAAGPRLEPYVYAGPALAFEVGCTVHVAAFGFSESADCDDEMIGAERKKFDVGAMLGAGFAVPAGPGSILVEGRYNFGLVNISEGADDKVRHRSGAVLFGYSFPIGTRNRM